MDLYGENRTMQFEGPVSRKQRVDATYGAWRDESAFLFDNYCEFPKVPPRLADQAYPLPVLICRVETRDDISKYYVISRV